jgi:hypothetical protein
VKKLLNILKKIFLSLIGLIALLLVLVNISSVQTFLAQRATKILSNKLNTVVSVDHVRIDLLNHLLLEGVYIQDLQKDTLAYIGKAEVRITDWFFLKNKVPVLQYLGLSNAYINLYRKSESNAWNYDFIEDAFSGPNPKKKENNKHEFSLDLEKVLLQRVRFHMKDAWVGTDNIVDIGNFALNADEIDFKKKNIQITSIKLDDANIIMRDYNGGRPPQPPKPKTVDTTAFNPNNWSISIKILSIKESKYAFIAKSTTPYLNEFDPEHIEVSKLSTEIDNIKIEGDTLKARILNFAALERSGFRIKDMHAKVSISPKASICRELYLETNNSKLKDYYAMHYNRFPDFLDYIEKVKMVVYLKKSKVDVKDIAYFAPQIKELPLQIVEISGEGAGTVEKLMLKNLLVKDQQSEISGNATIVGLPDIDNTYFNADNIIVKSNGNAITAYAPGLKNNPNINISALHDFNLIGNFKGKLNDFKTTFSFKSNLGNLDADIHLIQPLRQAPRYSGTIAAKGFDAGTLLNVDQLGHVTFDANLDGASFDLDQFKIKAQLAVNGIELNGYNYRGIIADGIFDKQKFDGKLLVNDSNIALGFYGSIDLSNHNIVINATANLLNSDLKALKFTDVPTNLSADFDLNYSGKTIDDFIGKAQLYNINLKRNNKRLDLDSISLISYLENSEKHIDIESNLLGAKIHGQFQLTEIPNSLSYYLSKYLPNYIQGPSKVPVDQKINFDIETRKINELLLAFTNNIQGFDHSKINGNLNTYTQQLNIEAQIPQATVAAVKINNATIDGKGDFNKLLLNATAPTFVIGDGIINSKLALDAYIGNDSISYKINTESDQEFGTATIQGYTIADNSTLKMSFMESDFFVNDKKWRINSGNEIVYADQYLSIKNLNLTSALQSINITTDDIFEQAINISVNNIDIGQASAFADMGDYQPEGRMNGRISISNIFNSPKINSNLTINDAKIGTDYIGQIALFGFYDVGSNRLKLDQNTAIVNQNFKLEADGDIYLGSTDFPEKLDANINIDNFPLKFLNPFLTGYASQLNGIIDGKIKLAGTTTRPNFDGNLTIKNGIAKVDYLGTLYSIPNGLINLDGKTITLKDIELFDVYKNNAIASGFVRFNDFANPELNIRLKTNQFEVVNLRDYENELFYGHVIAKTDFSITGSVSNMSMSINATPTQKSSLYLPYNGTGDYSKNTYITFKDYTQEATSIVSKAKPKEDKLSMRISAVLNTLLDVSLVLDPSTGDQISATGNGNLTINVPANDAYSMYGMYNIESGKYTFTFRQVLAKEFLITSGSNIAFSGDISNTKLNVNAIYPTRTRLYDLLDENEVNQIRDNNKEMEEAKASQPVNVLLNMSGTLASPNLNYEIELPEKRSLGTIAYTKLSRINSSDKTNLTNQVSALLFLGSFIPSQGISSMLATNAAKNTMGETIAAQATPLLTSALNKLLGEQNLQVMVQYKSIGQESLTGSGGSEVDSRNQVKVGIGKNYFNDRLKLQAGSSYDWGRPTAVNSSASTFNLAGDFRAQYSITADGRISITGFRSSNYDLFYGANVPRTGISLNYRKSFDNFYELIHSKKRVAREKALQEKGASQ